MPNEILAWPQWMQIVFDFPAPLQQRQICLAHARWSAAKDVNFFVIRARLENLCSCSPVQYRGSGTWWWWCSILECVLITCKLAPLTLQCMHLPCTLAKYSPTDVTQNLKTVQEVNLKKSCPSCQNSTACDRVKLWKCNDLGVRLLVFGHWADPPSLLIELGHKSPSDFSFSSSQKISTSRGWVSLRVLMKSC